MFDVIIIRADYEGWWLFDDWQNHIIYKESYPDYEAFSAAYQQQLKALKNKFTNELIGKHNIYAFYNNCEIEYCADCDEDMQIFYSLITLKDGEIYYE
ncbi:DUF1033 family protein [Macrococcus hajekii]|uniref:DUF1033 family protein n=1 Tax=Macrococcus hajekii TaxID=198482 RepID=A0A4R6BMJ6_9STAP|nr:DUF1033 family protein [Macrococcus hajekii]TDM03053.1 DUF1033 family protein [Macrococcus hajekii]GGB06176.1 hypothetical protein GCM10007190_12760 [Macrococcus hajekii]